MKRIRLLFFIVLLIFTFAGCGSSKSNVASTSKDIIDKDLSDDVSMHKCYYYKEQNASYITFYSFNHGEDDAVILLDDNAIYYGGVFSTIAEDDYDKIIEYGDYALYSSQVVLGDEDWVEVDVE